MISRTSLFTLTFLTLSLLPAQTMHGLPGGGKQKKSVKGAAASIQRPAATDEAVYRALDVLVHFANGVDRSLDTDQDKLQACNAAALLRASVKAFRYLPGIEGLTPADRQELATNFGKHLTVPNISPGSARERNTTALNTAISQLQKQILEGNSVAIQAAQSIDKAYTTTHLTPQGLRDAMERESTLGRIEHRFEVIEFMQECLHYGLLGCPSPAPDRIVALREWKKEILRAHNISTPAELTQPYASSTYNLLVKEIESADAKTSYSGNVVRYFTLNPQTSGVSALNTAAFFEAVDPTTVEAFDIIEILSAAVENKTINAKDRERLRCIMHAVRAGCYKLKDTLPFKTPESTITELIGALSDTMIDQQARTVLDKCLTCLHETLPNVDTRSRILQLLALARTHAIMDSNLYDHHFCNKKALALFNETIDNGTADDTDSLSENAIIAAAYVGQQKLAIHQAHNRLAVALLDLATHHGHDQAASANATALRQLPRNEQQNARNMAWYTTKKIGPNMQLIPMLSRITGALAISLHSRFTIDSDHDASAACAIDKDSVLNPSESVEEACMLAPKLRLLASELVKIKVSGIPSAHRAAQLWDILAETIDKTPTGAVPPTPKEAISVLNKHFNPNEDEEEATPLDSAYYHVLLQGIVKTLGELISDHPQECSALCEQLQILGKIKFNPTYAAKVVQDTTQDTYVRSLNAVFVAQSILDNHCLVPSGYTTLNTNAKTALIHALACFAETHRPEQSPSRTAVQLQINCLQQLRDREAVTYLDRYHTQAAEEGYCPGTLQEQALLNDLGDPASIGSTPPAAAMPRTSRKSAKKKNIQPAASATKPERSQKEIAAEVERLLAEDKGLQMLVKQERNAAAKKKSTPPKAPIPPKKTTSKEPQRGANKPDAKKPVQDSEQEAQKSGGDHASTTQSHPTYAIAASDSSASQEETGAEDVETPTQDHNAVDATDQQPVIVSAAPAEVPVIEQEQLMGTSEQPSGRLTSKERRKLERAERRSSAAQNTQASTAAMPSTSEHYPSANDTIQPVTLPMAQPSPATSDAAVHLPLEIITPLKAENPAPLTPYIQEQIRIINRRGLPQDERKTQVNDALLGAARLGNPENHALIETFFQIFHDLIDNNWRDEHENTILHNAAISGDLLITQLLVKKGRFDIHAKNKAGKTPLDVAIFFDHKNPALRALLGEKSTCAAQPYAAPSMVENYTMPVPMPVPQPCIPGTAAWVFQAHSYPYVAYGAPQSGLGDYYSQGMPPSSAVLPHSFTR